MSNQPSKVVVITGAGSGIGEAIALRLAAGGARVVLGARSPAPLEDLAERIRHACGTATPVPTNVASRTEMLHLITTAQQQHGRLDVLINNAGLSRPSRLDALQVDGWDEMIDVNLRGVLYGLAAALPIFKQQQSGHVINILSTSGLKIVPLQAVYAATKNAVRTLSEALRQESGASLRVTGISPGFVKTNIAASITDPATKAAILEKNGAPRHLAGRNRPRRRLRHRSARRRRRERHRRAHNGSGLTRHTSPPQPPSHPSP